MDWTCTTLKMYGSVSPVRSVNYTVPTKMCTTRNHARNQKSSIISYSHKILYCNSFPMQLIDLEPGNKFEIKNFSTSVGLLNLCHLVEDSILLSMVSIGQQTILVSWGIKSANM